MKRARSLPDKVKVLLSQNDIDQNKLVQITLSKNSPILEPKIEVLDSTFSQAFIGVAKRENLFNNVKFK